MSEKSFEKQLIATELRCKKRDARIAELEQQLAVKLDMAQAGVTVGRKSAELRVADLEAQLQQAQERGDYYRKLWEDANKARVDAEHALAAPTGEGQ